MAEPDAARGSLAQLSAPPTITGDFATKTFELDPALLTAEIDGLAAEFALVPDGDHAWLYHHPVNDLQVQVSTRRRGAGAQVLVHIAPRDLPSLPSTREDPLRPRLVVMSLVATLIASVVHFYSGGSLLFLALVFAGVAITVAWCLVFIGLALRVRSLLVQRRIRPRWISGWHRRFWPALAARLAERRPYR